MRAKDTLFCRDISVILRERRERKWDNLSFGLL